MHIPALTWLTLAACTLCVTIAVAMAFLVLWQAPRGRDNQLMAAFFLISGYGTANIFAARLSSVIGADPTFFFYEGFSSSHLAGIALLALALRYTHLWRYRVAVRVLLGGGLALWVLQLPAMHAGQLVHFLGYSEEGVIRYQLTPIGFVGMVGSAYALGAVVCLWVYRHRRAGSLLPGAAVVVVGNILPVLWPAVRPYPLPTSTAAIAMILMARAILREKLFNPMAELNRELADANEHLQSFAHTVAHDLKGPLNAVTGATQLLVEEFEVLTPEERRLFLDVVDRNSQAMLRIIDGILLLSHVRSGRVRLDPLDMRRIVADVQARFAPQITALGAVLAVSSELPDAIGYGPWVEAVWVNYVSNALKYGGQEPRIDLGGRRRADGMCEFWVQDAGPGLTIAEQQRLFQPFARLDGHIGEGHGLGLSIVQRIAERLGGSAWVSSEGIAGRGSRFHFSLPAADEG